ncbi:fork head domain-containing protein [Mycena vulgaris]|nr:fork head domain-containing protein [Mycena vulgaris]
MHGETHSNHAYRYPSLERYRVGSNLSLQPAPPRMHTPTRRRLTGPHYLQNILNSDSEPEAEASSSKQPENGRRGPEPEFEPSQLHHEEAADYLRKQLCLLPDVIVDLWAIADPPDGQKPFASLPTLVKLAIHGSPQRRLTLQGICDALISRFTWFHDHRQDDAWKNSVRHNLSLNKVFRKIPRDVTQMGKGCYWELDLSGGEGHKRPRKRRKFEKCAESDHDESEGAESPEGTPEAIGRSVQIKEEPRQAADSLILVQPYFPAPSRRRE